VQIAAGAGEYIDAAGKAGSDSVIADKGLGAAGTRGRRRRSRSRRLNVRHF
jgi:hypothetical protein